MRSTQDPGFVLKKQQISHPLMQSASPQKAAAMRDHMLSYAITFLIIAIIAGVLGFVGIAGLAAEIARILFFVFLVLFVVSLVAGRRPPV
jgi:uncharacterized membrane protein YtjA (UPF0391 family)